MPARTRSRSFPCPIAGTARRVQNGSLIRETRPATVVGKTESCQDTVGERDRDNSLLIERSELHIQGLNGEYRFPSPPGLSVIFNDFRCEAYTGPKIVGAPSLPAQSVANDRLKLVVNTNPSRADADLAVSVAELRTAPRAVFEGGRQFLREVRSSRTLRELLSKQQLKYRKNPLQEGAGGYLGMMFGILPLISDIEAIADSSSLMANRLRELQNLRDGNGMRKKVKIGSTTAKSGPLTGTLTSVTGIVIGYRARSYVTRRVWGTQRWEMDQNFRPPNTDHRRIMEARRAVYGLNIDFVTAWNLMPWSWLIDYFAEVGDLVEATRNSVGANAGRQCLMTETIEAWVVDPSYLPEGLSGGSGISTRTTKRRQVFASPAGAGFRMTQPILTNRQVSILGALAISRVPKRD